MAQPGSVPRLRSTWLGPGSYRANLVLGLGAGCSHTCDGPHFGRAGLGLACDTGCSPSSLGGPGKPGHGLPWADHPPLTHSTPPRPSSSVSETSQVRV